MKAPTCGNMQLYSVIVTKDQDNRKTLAEFHFNQPASVKAPVILTICADFFRFSKWCNLKGAEPGYSNFHSFITALTDAIIFSQQITTLAEMNGLGTCFLGTVNYNADKISELLDLPELVVPVASIALGYPEEEGENTERLSIDAILHNEKYRHDTEEEIIAQFDVKENFPANRGYVIENKKPSLAHVFTDIRYPKEMNEEVSESFLNLIKKKRFFKKD